MKICQGYQHLGFTEAVKLRLNDEIVELEPKDPDKTKWTIEGLIGVNEIPYNRQTDGIVEDISESENRKEKSLGIMGLYNDVIVKHPTTKDLRGEQLVLTEGQFDDDDRWSDEIDYDNVLEKRFVVRKPKSFDRHNKRPFGHHGNTYESQISDVRIRRIPMMNELKRLEDERGKTTDEDIVEDDKTVERWMQIFRKKKKIGF